MKEKLIIDIKEKKESFERVRKDTFEEIENY